MKLKSRFFAGESGGVFKGMLTLLVGAGLARVVSLISIPILARIYSPEDYGVLSLYTSLIAVLAPIMTLRYVQAIPLPKTDVIAFNLFSLCFKLIALFAVFVAIILAFFGESILGWFNMEVLMPWRWLIVLGAAGTALYELFSLWATRKRQYKTIAKTQLTQSLIGNIAKIGLGLLAFKPSGIIIGQFLSQSAGITSFFKDARKEIKAYLPRVKKSKQKFVAKYYQDFFWFRLPSQFLMVLSVQAPVMMMAALYDKEATGQLGLAIMALSLPVSLIGGAMAKAYYAEIAYLGQSKIPKIRLITISIQKKLLSIGIPATAGVYFFAEPIFIVLFGEEWRTAGIFAASMSPYILLQFTSAPLVQVLNVVGSQVLFLFVNLIRVLGLFFVGALTLYLNISDYEFVVFISAFLFIFYLFITALIYIIINRASNDY